MATSVGKVDKELKFFKRQHNLSPQARKSKYFDEESSGVEGESATSSSSERTNKQFTIERRGDNFRDKARRLFKRQSHMFVKGKTDTLRTEEDFDSEVQVMTDSQADDDDADDGSQTVQDPNGVQDNGAPQLTQTTSIMRKTSGDPTTVSKGQQQTEDMPLFRKNSTFITIWNIVIMTSILSDLVLIPLEISLQDVESFSSFSFTVINLIQCIYIADLFINLNKSYYDKHVSEVTDLQTIRLRYFQSYDFLIDILACAPILAFKKIFFFPKGYNQMFLLIRTVKFLKIKQIVVESHQRYFVSSQVYFLSYLISVLVIVESAH